MTRALRKVIARHLVWALAFALLAACGGGKGASVSGGGAGGTSSRGRYSLCDGSSAMRLGVVSEGGQVKTTYPLTNPHGHSFLFIDGHCHYYASASWMEGVVEGDLLAKQASQIEKDLALGRVDALDYHDLESCPDAGVQWLRTASGYADCTCDCDAKAPAGVEAALVAAGLLRDDLIEAGDPLAGPILMVAILEDSLVLNSVLQTWPLIWPLSDIGVTWEAYTRAPDTILRHLTGSEAEAARTLRAAPLKVDPYASGIRVSDQGKVYDLFMREELPDDAQRAIDRLLGD